MNQSPIAAMTKAQTTRAMYAVEDALAEKFTKSAVVAALAKIGLCSPKSTGVEKTFYAKLKSEGVQSERFFRLMNPSGQTPAPTAKAVAPATAPKSTATAPPVAVQKSPYMFSLHSVSLIVFDVAKRLANVVFKRAGGSQVSEVLVADGLTEDSLKNLPVVVKRVESL